VQKTSPEVILGLPTPRADVPPITRVKGQWLASSIRTVREAGHIDRYVQKIDASVYDVVRSAGVNDWIPASIAVAHYEALDRLELPPSEILSMGASAVRHGHGKPIGVIIKLTPLAGVTPFTLIALSGRLWRRIFDGGGITAFKLGPKEARIDYIGLPFAHIAYARIALRGTITGSLGMLGNKVYVREHAALSTAGTVSVRVSWV
jgi:hypothetical protein